MWLSTNNSQDEARYMSYLPNYILILVFDVHCDDDIFALFW